MAVVFYQQGVVFFLFFLLGGEVTVALGRAFESAGVLDRLRAGDVSAKDAGDQRIRSQTVRAVILKFTLASRENAADVGRLLIVHPEPAHRVMHAGENLHGGVAWIISH